LVEQPEETTNPVRPPCQKKKAVGKKKQTVGPPQSFPTKSVGMFWSLWGEADEKRNAQDPPGRRGPTVFPPVILPSKGTKKALGEQKGHPKHHLVRKEILLDKTFHLPEIRRGGHDPRGTRRGGGETTKLLIKSEK